jgi:hypothetical protein
VLGIFLLGQISYRSNVYSFKVLCMIMFFLIDCMIMVLM